MIDIILYIPDLTKFRVEGDELASKRDPLFSFDDGSLVYNVKKIPVCYSGNESVCLVRGLDSDVDRLESIERLGVCIDKEYIYDSPESEAIYDRVNGPLEVGLNDGEKMLRPKMIGVFA